MGRGITAGWGVVWVCGGVGASQGRKAGRGKHRLAGKLTTNTYARGDSRAEMNQTKAYNEQIITSIFKQERGNLYRKKWHTAILAACIVLYITKKEVFTKTNTHCHFSI